MFVFVPAQQIVGQFLQSFAEFPPRQKPSSFSVDDALDKVRETQKQLETANGGSVK
jgi:arylsulfatase